MLERIRALVPFDPARQRLVLINPNASELLPHRRWMPERFAELIGRILAAYADVVVLITGAPEERASAEELAAAQRSALGLLRRPFEPCRPAGALRACGADGDATIPVRRIFPRRPGFPPSCCSARRRRNFTSRSARRARSMPGSPVRPASRAHNHRKTACTDNVCMQAIAVDEVYAAVAEVLARAARRLMTDSAEASHARDSQSVRTAVRRAGRSGAQRAHHAVAACRLCRGLVGLWRHRQRAARTFISTSAKCSPGRTR